MKPNQEKINYLELLAHEFNRIRELTTKVEDIKCMQNIIINRGSGQPDRWYLGRKALISYNLATNEMTDTIQIPMVDMVSPMLNRLLNYYTVELQNAIDSFNNLKE
jgi:hypothetical protein